MADEPSPRRLAATGGSVFGAGVLLLGVEGITGGRDVLAASGLAIVVCLPAFCLGVLLSRRRPANPTGAALIALAAGPCIALAIEGWARSASTVQPLPLASAVAVVAGGAWLLNLAGFVLLCLTFPDAYPLDRRSRNVSRAFVLTATAVAMVIAVQSQGLLAGVPAWMSAAASAVTGFALILVLGGCIAVLTGHYRAGDEVRREQMRWLFLGCLSVPVFLVAGWLLQYAGAPVWMAYLGFMTALLIALPVSITVAVLRHDLLDIDRLLSDSVSAVLTAAAAAGVFAGLVLLVTQAGSSLGGTTAGVTAAAFATALFLLPLHRRLQRAVGRIVDPDRAFARATVADYVQSVQEGRRQPEEVEAVLRECLGDPTLRLVLTLPDSQVFVDLSGDAMEPPDGPEAVMLRSREAPIGAILLSRPTARRLRLARELAVDARLPIEVSRLRLGLRDALADASASRTRLVEAAAQERLRLERDLHDGIQPRILAVGMRLRSLQRQAAEDTDTHQELDDAVGALEEIVRELRRLAHGLRPSGLDDGLEQAIRGLVRHSPIPVELDLTPVELSEAQATTAYYVVAEALSNTFKHANATSATVLIRPLGARASIIVSDDGHGGARVGTGLVSLRDRVAALGGSIDVHSPVGQGTLLQAEI